MDQPRYHDPFEGCETREEYMRRFAEIVQHEIEVAGYVAEYLEARAAGENKEQAGSALPRAETPVGRKVEDLRIVVDILVEAREAARGGMPSRP